MKELSIEELRYKIIENKNIVIYGTGKYAKVLYAYIQMENLESHIKCFTVTNVDANEQEVFGKKVKSFSDIEENLKEYIVLLAMSEKAQQSVYKQFNNLNNTRVYDISKKMIDELLKCLYERYSQFPIQRNKIFVECFEGLGYRCNCKYIVEKLLEEKKPVEIVWAVHDLKEEMPDLIKKVPRYTREYYEELYTSGIRIGNNGPSRFTLKRLEQYYLDTWHGSGPFKKMRASLYEGNEAIIKQIESNHKVVDVFISNTGTNTSIFREAFCYDGEIYECGSPRNDVFFVKNNIRSHVCSKLGIDSSKRIILYAPTFRNDREQSFGYYDLDWDSILYALKERFHEEFILLYRFHHLLYKYDSCHNYFKEGINVTLYPDMQELLVATDVLITDYSSSMWDFSLLDRPIFLYHNDEKEYISMHGFYSEPSEWPYPKARSNREMLEIIKAFNENEYLQAIHAFIDKHRSFDDGHASERVVERIMDVIVNPQKYGKEI